MNKARLLEAYYRWLCGLVEVNKADVSYWLLVKRLHVIEFKWFVPNDDNRAFDGRKLREDFCDEHDFDFSAEYFDHECSMLELLIGLSYRCEFIMADPSEIKTVAEWFWVLISNAGLSIFGDPVYYDIGGDHAVDTILNRIIERTYKRNGTGGLFPLKFTKKDQRKVELWFQMDAYLVENYYISEKLL